MLLVLQKSVFMENEAAYQCVICGNVLGHLWLQNGIKFLTKYFS